MLPLLTWLLILFVVACLFEWEWLATLIGIVSGCVLIYCLFVYFTEVMIGLVCIIGGVMFIAAGGLATKAVTKIKEKE